MLGNCQKEKLGTLERVYQHIPHIPPIYGFYNGCIGQYGVMFEEQLLRYPPKGTQYFPLKLTHWNMLYTDVSLAITNEHAAQWAKPKKPKGEEQVSWGRTALKDDLSSAPSGSATKSTCLESQNSVEKNADRSKRLKGKGLLTSSTNCKTKKCAAIKRKNYIWWIAKKSLFFAIERQNPSSFWFWQTD